MVTEEQASSPDLQAFILLDVFKPRFRLVALCFRQPPASTVLYPLASPHLSTTALGCLRMCRDAFVDGATPPADPAKTASPSLPMIGPSDTLALFTRHSCCTPPTAAVGRAFSAVVLLRDWHNFLHEDSAIPAAHGATRISCSLLRTRPSSGVVDSCSVASGRLLAVDSWWLADPHSVAYYLHR